MYERQELNDVSAGPAMRYHTRGEPPVSEQETQYQKANPVSPTEWGPGLWKFLHISARFYPDQACSQRIQAMFKFITAMPSVLPCDACAKHANDYIRQTYQQLTEAVKTRRDIFRYLVDFHNYVNQRLGKSMMSYDEAWKLYGN